MTIVVVCGSCLRLLQQPCDNLIVRTLTVVCICNGKPAQSAVQPRCWFTWYFCRLWK